jgi:hypothetical protein
VLDPANVPPVAVDELLSRFVLFPKHVRSSDNTVKQDAFMPHPRVELSMTRHVEATEAELWQEGERVALIRTRPLYGRAVVCVREFVNEGLVVVAKPIVPENPNHADAVNWPTEKASQKMIALQIAVKSAYVPKAQPNS